MPPHPSRTLLRALRALSPSLALMLAPWTPALGAELPRDPRSDRLDAVVRAYHDAGLFMGTVLVADGGEVVFERGFGWANLELSAPAAPESRFRLASVTKTLTATLVMRLVEAGRIRLDAPISEYLPAYRRDTGGLVLVRHLLDHSSGIPNFIEAEGFLARTVREPFPGRDAFLARFCSGDLDFEPGTRFHYNNCGYALLAAIVEEVTGESFEAALREGVFEPAGMRGAGLDRADLLLPQRAFNYERGLDGAFRPASFWEPAWVSGAGAAYGTARDLFAFDRALADGRLLRPETVAEMTAPRRTPPWGGAYGYGWSLRELALPDGRLELQGHEGGIFGVATRIERAPVRGQVVVALSNVADRPLRQLADDLFLALAGARVEPPKRPAREEIYQTLERSGLAAARARWVAIRQSEADRFAAGPGELNRLGYALLRAGRTADAIEVFRWNVTTFPADGNLHDSLSEALEAVGARDESLRAARRALELSPDLDAARERLARLQAPAEPLATEGDAGKPPRR